MKLTWPGNPTEPRLITTDSAAPVASCAAERSMPIGPGDEAGRRAMYWIGLVMRNSDTAIGSTSADDRGG